MKFADDTRPQMYPYTTDVYSSEIFEFRNQWTRIQLFVDLTVARSFTYRGRDKSMGSSDDIGISGVDAKWWKNASTPFWHAWNLLYWSSRLNTEFTPCAVSVTSIKARDKGAGNTHSRMTQWWTIRSYNLMPTMWDSHEIRLAELVEK